MPGAADTAKLIAELSLKDKFSAGAKTAMGSLDKLEGKFAKLGGIASNGLSSAARNVKILGAAATVGLAAGVKGGLDSLATLEDAVSAVDGAIAQMGLTGQITGKQVAGWANKIESDVEAAFDDKDIAAGAATLLRFGKVTATNLEPALVVMTDLAAKTGDVDSAATLLAKVLADPATAAGKLSKAGVVLTDAQEDTVKAMAKAGDEAGAQAFLLKELEKTTRGAAKTMAGPARDAQNQLNDAIEDGERALATGFLPLIGRVRTELAKKLADPAVLAQIEGFGATLAAGFDSAIALGKQVPWGTIGEGLRIGGEGAKAIAGAFGGLPEETKGLILAMAGLSKLTGGAPIKIAVDLAKTAFDQFFGRGSTPATPLFVSDISGGLGGKTPPVAPTGGIVLPVIGAAGFIDKTWLQSERERVFTALGRDPATGAKLEDIESAIVRKADAAEALIRGELRKPAPILQANVNVRVAIDGRDVQSSATTSTVSSTGMPRTSGGGTF